MKNEYKFTFFFTSGTSVEVVFTEEKKNEILDALKNGQWKNCFTTGQEVGFTFSHITHYIVKKYSVKE